VITFHGFCCIVVDTNLTNDDVALCDCLVWAREHCRISPSCLLAECCKRRLNQGSFFAVFCVFCFFIVAFNPLTPTVTIWVEHQSVRMSKITNDGLIQSGTGCFLAVFIWQQWASKGFFCIVCIFNLSTILYFLERDVLMCR